MRVPVGRLAKTASLAFVALVVLGLVAGIILDREPRSQDVADGWREMLTGVLPPEATGLRVLANHYDDSVAIFEYLLPGREPAAAMADIDARFTDKYLGYAVTERTPAMLRLRCDDLAATHWSSFQYEFHVCARNAAAVVVGMRMGNKFVDARRVAYEAEAARYAKEACAVEHGAVERGDAPDGALS